MPRTLSLEEFDAPYGQPTPAPRTLTLEQFEARESLPPIPRRRPEFTEGLEGLPAPKDVVRTKPMVDLREGGQSFERTITVTEQRLNEGRPTIPTIWNGQQLSDNDAITEAINSGMRFPSYGAVDEAVQAAQKRSRVLGKAAGMNGGKPRTLSIEQFEAREAAPEAPAAIQEAVGKAFKDFYEGAIVAPARNLYGGFKLGAAGASELEANAMMLINRAGDYLTEKTGIGALSKDTAFGKVEQWLSVRPERS